MEWLEPRIAELINAVRAPDDRVGRSFRVRQLGAARPAGSLGRLDRVVEQMCAANGRPPTGRRVVMAISVLAGDHGVAIRGVSRFRPSTTRALFELIRSGGAPVNVIAEGVGASVCAADFGIRGATGVAPYKLGEGTNDIVLMSAMERAVALQAVANGAAYLREVVGEVDIVAVGEIGVGNTTSTTAVVARLLGIAPSSIVGIGGGLPNRRVPAKAAVIAAALRRSRVDPSDTVGLMADLGGFEICGNVGVIIAAASERRLVLLDGYMAATSALLATQLCPAVAGYLVAAHRSTEPGHGRVLAALGLKPLLDLHMRLGMASGAALALSLIRAAFAVTVRTPASRSVGL